MFWACIGLSAFPRVLRICTKLDRRYQSLESSLLTQWIWQENKFWHQLFTHYILHYTASALFLSDDVSLLFSKQALVYYKATEQNYYMYVASYKISSCIHTTTSTRCSHGTVPGSTIAGTGAHISTLHWLWMGQKKWTGILSSMEM